MQRISVHISDETKRRLDFVTEFKNKVEAEVIREAIDAGLNFIIPTFNSAKALVDLGRQAKRLSSQRKEPRDVSSDTAKYAFGIYK